MLLSDGFMATLVHQGFILYHVSFSAFLMIISWSVLLLDAYSFAGNRDDEDDEKKTLSLFDYCSHWREQQVISKKGHLLDSPLC